MRAGAIDQENTNFPTRECPLWYNKEGVYARRQAFWRLFLPGNIFPSYLVTRIFLEVGGGVSVHTMICHRFWVSCTEELL